VKSFLVGLLVVILMALASVVGILLLPLLLVMGFFLRWILSFALILFAIWLIGKVTLVSLDYWKKREERHRSRFVRKPQVSDKIAPNH